MDDDGDDGDDDEDDDDDDDDFYAGDFSHRLPPQSTLLARVCMFYSTAKPVITEDEDETCWGHARHQPRMHCWHRHVHPQPLLVSPFQMPAWT